MSTKIFYRTLTRVSGIICALTIVTEKDIWYFNGLFLIVCAVWLWGEYDWYKERKYKGL